MPNDIILESLVDQNTFWIKTLLGTNGFLDTPLHMKVARDQLRKKHK